MKSVLTIAGSDPSGGAGIQQDLRVFAALGVAGLSAITALTVQNSQGVKAVHPVDADVLQAQIEAVLEDATDLGAVKIGMLGGAAQVRAVAEMLRRFRPPNVVLDPVLASSGGVPLLDEEGRAALLMELLPLCDLVTPNAPEAAILSGLMDVATEEDVAEAGRRLLAQGARAVLIKGGHIAADTATDFFFRRAGTSPLPYRQIWVSTSNTHGTGCFLSSAIAALMGRARHRRMASAVSQAKSLLWNGLTEPVVAGRGKGYPDVIAALRLEKGMPTVQPLSVVQGLYVITDANLRPDRTVDHIVRKALDGGARIIQIRDKTLPTSELIRLCSRINMLVRSKGAVLIVNDRVDVAMASGAGGVHLGPDDMSPQQARYLLGPHRLIGVSVSNVKEAMTFYNEASYLAVGAIFGSTTKSDAGDAVGVECIREIRKAIPHKPIVAIGGINSGNIDAVIAAGADSAAVISAVVCAPDMEAATRELVSHFPAMNRPAETAAKPKEEE